MRMALIEKSSGKVINVILCDASYGAPDGHALVESQSASPGDAWDGQTFTTSLTPSETNGNALFSFFRRWWS